MSSVGIKEDHWMDGDVPAGGATWGTGFAISWQRGALRETGGCYCGAFPKVKSPNGAFVEDVLQAVIGRIEFYQKSKFKCERNRKALQALYTALHELQERTAEREARGVEGTHKV